MPYRRTEKVTRKLAARHEAIMAAACALAAEGGLGSVQMAAVAAVVGALIEGLIGPLAPGVSEAPAEIRAQVQTLTLFGLRGLGVIDARARGLVVQTALPSQP